MKNAGVKWVRMDVKKPIESSLNPFTEANKLGLKVIAVIKSKTMLRGLGHGADNYLPGSDWGGKWRESVKEAIINLGPFVDIWQIDNELNHPWHNPIPSCNIQLAVDIVKGGADAVKNMIPEAKVAVNLFFNVGGPVPISNIDIIRDEPFIIKFKEELKEKIDILGMDIYKGTWHKGSPVNYPDDLNRYHELWEGDIIITETGFCTGILGRSEVHQAHHVKEAFQSLDDNIRNIPWFRGIMWYEYDSKHSGFPCENSFGLHKENGFEEKPAWEEFVKMMIKYKRCDKILGITYHY